MKALNLRMDDEQHAQLARWAKESRRSMNAEALHRLFPPPMQTGPHPGFDSERAYLEREVKPDPKPGRK